MDPNQQPEQTHLEQPAQSGTPSDVVTEQPSQAPDPLSADANVSGRTIIIAIVLTIAIPLIGATEWHIFRYCFPIFIGTFFFLTFNRFNFQDGKGATVGASLLGFIVPLVGVPYVVDGLYGTLFKPKHFGPIPVELAVYAIPFLVGSAYLLSGHKILNRG